MERHERGTGEYGTGTEKLADIAEMEITEPTLTWLEVSHPQQPIPLGENDRVIDSRFNEQQDVWEVLLHRTPGRRKRSSYSISFCFIPSMRSSTSSSTLS